MSALNHILGDTAGAAILNMLQSRIVVFQAPAMRNLPSEVLMLQSVCVFQMRWDMSQL